MTLLMTAYLKGKSACEAKIIQEKVVVYEKAQGNKNRSNRVPDGASSGLLKQRWKRVSV